MERLLRHLRNARVRGDLLEVAVLNGRIRAQWAADIRAGTKAPNWTETELRAAWGDR